jgi:hypothetical protein
LPCRTGPPYRFHPNAPALPSSPSAAAGEPHRAPAVVIASGRRSPPQPGAPPSLRRGVRWATSTRFPRTGSTNSNRMTPHPGPQVRHQVSPDGRARPAACVRLVGCATWPCSCSLRSWTGSGSSPSTTHRPRHLGMRRRRAPPGHQRPLGRPTRALSYARSAGFCDAFLTGRGKAAYNPALGALPGPHGGAGVRWHRRPGEGSALTHLALRTFTAEIAVDLVRAPYTCVVAEISHTEPCVREGGGGTRTPASRHGYVLVRPG